jgi:hypothetical protein
MSEPCLTITELITQNPESRLPKKSHVPLKEGRLIGITEPKSLLISAQKGEKLSKEETFSALSICHPDQSVYA